MKTATTRGLVLASAAASLAGFAVTQAVAQDIYRMDYVQKSADSVDNDAGDDRLMPQTARSFYIAPNVSWSELDSDSGLDNGLGFGVKVGVDMSRYWSTELSIDYAEADATKSSATSPDDDVALFSLSIDAVRRFGNDEGITPFALAGLGYAKTGSYANEYDGIALAVGGGVLAPIPNWPANLRAELRARYTNSDSELDQSNYLDWILSAGVQFDIGGDNVKSAVATEAVSVAVPAKALGLDTDGDGVPDQRDRCMDTAPGITVNPRGCEVDTDADGVVDSKDQCLDTDIGIVVGKSGCALFLDIDDDGVLNEDDQCPESAAGVSVDASGCEVKMALPAAPADSMPMAKPLDIVQLDGVEFEYKSTRLTAAAQRSLLPHVKHLQENSNLLAEVAGHTDNKASRAYNQRLSERRAQAVRDFLVENGAPASQLTVRGYSEMEPIATNTTEAGRAKNRRVELRILAR